MADWASPNLAPKRAHRFELSIPGPYGPEVWTVTKVSRPAFSVSEVEHNFWDKKYYYPGRVSWDPCTVTLVDPISPDISGKLMATLIKSGYRFPNVDYAAGGKRTLSKAEGNGALGTVAIKTFSHMAAAEGGVTGVDLAPVEQFNLHNAFVTGMNFGEMDYSSDELVTVELTMRYDWASYEVKEVPASNAGTPAQRLGLGEADAQTVATLFGPQAGNAATE